MAFSQNYPWRTINGLPAPTTNHLGFANSAMYFDGIGDYISIPSPTFDFDDDATFVFHLKISSAATGNIRLIDTRPSSFSNSSIHAWIDLQNDLLEISIEAGKFTNFAFNSSPDLWYVIAIVHDDLANNVIAYANGVAMQAVGGSFGDFYYDGSNVQIGARSDLVSSEFFEGVINAFCVYDCAMSPAEISDITFEKTTSIGDGIEKSTGIKVFPNPANLSLTIELSEVNRSSGEMTLMDPTGKVITQIPIEPGQQHYAIDTYSLSEGVYILSIKTDALLGLEKVVIQR